MKKVKGEDGFTLIEMMIVLLIISVLVLIAIPNVAKHSEKIDEKGCEAYVKMVEGQVVAYKMDNPNSDPSLDDLIAGDYLPKEAKCPDGTELTIENGKVTKLGKSG
ncbi:competence type IV pilus major pilin ComGC [Sporosarcina sp. UB5]|uniref:competence type IV pilus major pilin ComGC n=1 Tax=Sporosarcina sp. UB5 TaxID=3047463 RepID=UPI003D7B63F8